MPTPSLIRADACSRSETAVLPAFGIGESMSIRDYVERIILTDPEFVSLRRRCHWQNSVMFSRRFCPASFTSERVEKFGKAVANLLVCEPDRRPDILDHLWRGEPGSSWPLTLRIAQRKNPTVGLVETDVPEQPDPSNVLGLEELKHASLRRDFLVSQMVEAIANGEIRVMGFLAGDLHRQRLKVAADWWRDPAMVCNWQAEELSPKEGAPAGTPYYRGLQLAPITDCAPQAHGSISDQRLINRTRQKPGQSTVDAWVLNAMEEARRQHKPPPKRDNDVYPRCNSAIGGTDLQVKEAYKKLPGHLKRTRGQRDR